LSVAPSSWSFAEQSAWLGLPARSGHTFGSPSFVPTGDGVHGLYPSRDAESVYVANRGEGKISLISFATTPAPAG
jgi:hypothetical protein